MKPIGFRLIAAFSFALAIAAALSASTAPRYGGILRVEMLGARISIDPREWKDGSPEFARNEKMAALVFDRLVALDNYGRFQPQLATEWTHDAAYKRWQFTLRLGVKFSDGSLLTAKGVVAALQPLLPSTQQISPGENDVVFQSSAPMPDLLEELASGKYFVYRVQSDGTLLGTGPFFVVDSPGDENLDGKAVSQPNDTSSASVSRNSPKSSHLRFRANGDAWSGRPFVDAIDVTLNVTPLRALFDLQLGKADLVELSPELVHRATQDNLRVWTSSAVTFYGLRFDEPQAIPTDPKLRESLSLALDRTTMANVLLQRQAEPSCTLLPQWLSGYAFLFHLEGNVARAKEIRAALPPNVAAGSVLLRLRVDASGDLAKLLGERVAVNARQSSIAVQIVNASAQHSAGNADSASPAVQPAGVHLFVWRYSSLAPRAELDSLVTTMHLEKTVDTSTVTSSDPEQLYAREKRILGERQILPLIALPEFVGLGQNVRDWMPASWGEWHLADVWLDGSSSSASQPGAASSAEPTAMPLAPVSNPGAKP
jgi:ABC-type transport system substrate-binding protein